MTRTEAMRLKRTIEDYMHEEYPDTLNAATTAVKLINRADLGWNLEIYGPGGIHVTEVTRG